MLRVVFEIEGKRFGLWAGLTKNESDTDASRTQRVDDMLRTISSVLETRGLTCDPNMSVAIMNEEMTHTTRREG